MNYTSRVQVTRCTWNSVFCSTGEAKKPTFSFTFFFSFLNREFEHRDAIFCKFVQTLTDNYIIKNYKIVKYVIEIVICNYSIIIVL